MKINTGTWLQVNRARSGTETARADKDVGTEQDE